MPSALRVGWAAVSRRRTAISVTASAGLVLALVLAASWLALTNDFVGPHLAFEFSQAKAAMSGQYEGYRHFNYVHLWTLRAFLDVVDTRPMAGGLYGAVASSALVLAIYLVGLRSGGRVVGVLAALLALSFAPLATSWAIPIRQTPSTLYACAALLCALVEAHGLRLRLLSMASGLLCFASLYSDVCGIAVWPVVLWVHATTSGQTWRALAMFALGVALGQLGLMAVDGLMTGDPLQSLHAGGFRQAFYHLSGTPWKVMKRTHTFRSSFFGALVGLGTREILALGVLGLALAVADNAVVRLLVSWAVLALPVVAWTIERSNSMAAFGIVVFAPALCVGAAHLLQRVWQLSGPERDLVPAWMAIFVGVLVCVLGVSGIQANINHQWLEHSGHAATRGDMFLFRLTVPLALASAALLRVRFLRAIPLALAFAALLLGGRSQVARYRASIGDEVQVWRSVAEKVFESGHPKMAVYYARAEPQRFRPSMIENRLNLLADRDAPPVKVRTVSSPKRVDDDEFLFVDYGNADMVFFLRFSQPPPFHLYLARVDYGRSVGRIFLPPDAAPAPRPPAPAQRQP